MVSIEIEIPDTVAILVYTHAELPAGWDAPILPKQARIWERNGQNQRSLPRYRFRQLSYQKWATTYLIRSTAISVKFDLTSQILLCLIRV
jgi:hypothetical protein